jgi:putative transposase
MRKSRFNEEEVLSALRDVAHGTPVRTISLKVGVSESTIYQWKARYEGLEAAGVARLRALEQENSQLRRITDLQCLHINVLKAELARNPRPIESNQEHQ